MSIAGSSPGLGNGFLDSNPSPSRPRAWLGAVEISLEPPPGNGPSWLLSACLVHVLSWGAAPGSLLPSAIDPPPLGSLLEPLLALPQELTWLLFSPPMLIWSHQCGTGPWLGVASSVAMVPAAGGQNLELLAVWWIQSARAAQPITIWCPI